MNVRTLGALAVALLAARGLAAQSRDDAVFHAMRDELARSMAQLRLDTMPRPYFIAYRVEEVEVAGVAARRGSLMRSDQAVYRHLSVEVRVGDYDFDNTNFMGGTADNAGFSRFDQGGRLPLDSNYTELRRQLWLATDGAYKEAIETLANKRAALRGRSRTDYVPDLSREPTTTISDVMPAPRIDRFAAESTMRRLSSVFADEQRLQKSGVSWHTGVRKTWYVNSEGSSFVRTVPSAEVHIAASTQTADGLVLADFVSLRGLDAASLPPAATIADSIRAMTARLEQLGKAQPPALYQGPVLFEGEAAAELFAMNVAGMLAAERAPMADNPMFEQFMSRGHESLLDRIGTRVLPRFMSVSDQPMLTAFEGQPLDSYRVDDDAVPARETRLVERGVLKTLVTTRVPVRDLRRSTGNRWGHGASVKTLVVTVDSGLTRAALRARALQLAAENGSDYVVVVRRIAMQAGAMDPMTYMMMRAADDAEQFPATLVYKLFRDGREELMRGAQIEGLRLDSFRDIAAASADRVAFSTSGLAARASRRFRGGMMGSWSGLTPTAGAVVAPSVLFRELTVRKQSGHGLPLPILPPPPRAP